MPPPVTPAPRRFILNPRQSESLPKQNQPKAPSAPNSDDPRRVQPFASTPKTNSAKFHHKQFAQTPRFVSNPSRETKDRLHHAFAPGPSNEPSAPGPATDGIQELSQDDNNAVLMSPHSPHVSDDMLIDEPAQVPSHAASIHSPRAKRPRLSAMSPEGISSTSSHASTPRPATISAHRFLPMQAREPNEAATQEHQAMSSRPAFLVSHHSPEAHDVDPLPAQLSPHRRQHKFVEGGMAASMRSIIMELAPMAPQPQKWEETWGFRSTQVQNGASATLALGVMDDGREERFLLVGHDKHAQGISGGQRVTVKGISWDIQLEGDKWIVCVDWNVDR